jgi:hypothetical protein
MSHDTELLIRSAQLAGQSYDNVTGALKFENKRTDTTCFVLQTTDCDYVIWRGTESKRDWLYNLLFIPRPVQKAWIHMGFYRAQQGVWKDVRKVLNPAKKTVQIGHSLGGACAEISCLLSREFQKLHLITFGKPNTFARFRKCRMDHLKTQYSVVHGSDIVARIPRFGYRPSTGTNLKQLWFANNGLDFINPDVKIKKQDWKVGESVSDHMMGGYQERMDAFCQNQHEPKVDAPRPRKRRKGKKG